MSIHCTVLASKGAVKSLLACSGYAELPWALPCCCGLCPVAVGSALLPCVIPCSPVYMGVLTSVVADSLCYCRQPRQRQVASAMAGCVSNDSVASYGLSASVMADALPPLSCTVLGSAVLAMKLSTPSISNCCFVGVGPAEPDHLALCLRAPPFFFFN